MKKIIPKYNKCLVFHRLFVIINSWTNSEVALNKSFYIHIIRNPTPFKALYLRKSLQRERLQLFENGKTIL